MLPKGRPEMSIFLVAARYAALGFDIACGQGFVGITLAAAVTVEDICRSGVFI
jgi:hypothetical protein